MASIDGDDAVLMKDVPSHPKGSDSFTLMSWNVLISSSNDGWWIFKNYCPNTPPDCTSWAYRKMLMTEKIKSANADIVCVQEASGCSYEEDFSFMHELGYDYRITDKQRMRCMTFWKRERFAVAYSGESFTKQRVLVVPLALLNSTRENKVVWIVNCHLTAGPDGAGRRVHQIVDALHVVHTKAPQPPAPKKKKKNKAGRQAKKLASIGAPLTMEEIEAELDDAVPSPPPGPKVIVCGDFNLDDNLLTPVKSGDSIIPAKSGVTTLLTECEVSRDFTEDGVRITKHHTAQKVGPFSDAYKDVYSKVALEPPATLIGAGLVPLMAGLKSEAFPSDRFIEATTRLFLRYADSDDKSKMSVANMERWLMDINLSTERGTEMRQARALLAASGRDYLTLEEFKAIHMEILISGEYWALAHSFYLTAKIAGELEGERDILPSYYLEARLPTVEEAAHLFAARFDYIFYKPDTLRLDGVVEIMKDRISEPMPNSREPSDHLPQIASFTMC